MRLLALSLVATLALFAQGQSEHSDGTALSSPALNLYTTMQNIDARVQPEQKWSFLVDGTRYELNGAQVASMVKSASAINQLKLQNTNLAIQNGQLSSQIEGLKKELESTRTQITQLRSNALVADLCSSAGIKADECSVSQDGTASKKTPSPVKPPEENAKADPKQ